MHVYAYCLISSITEICKIREKWTHRRCHRGKDGIASSVSAKRCWGRMCEVWSVKQFILAFPLLSATTRNCWQLWAYVLQTSCYSRPNGTATAHIIATEHLFNHASSSNDVVSWVHSPHLSSPPLPNGIWVVQPYLQGLPVWAARRYTEHGYVEV